MNGGVNGEVVWSMRQRLDDVLACAPTFLVVLAGTNDWKGIYNAAWGDRSCKNQSLPVTHLSPEHFEQSLSELIDDARAALPASSTVLVCEIPPMGEDLAAPPNANIVKRANDTIRRLVAAREGHAGEGKVILVRTHEALVTHLVDSTHPTAAATADRRAPRTATSNLTVGRRPKWLLGPEPFDRWILADGGAGHGGAFPPSLADRALSYLPRYQACVVRKYLFLENWDSIGRRYGYRIMTDGLHLNDTGGAIVAKTIAAAIWTRGWPREDSRSTVKKTT